MSKTTKGPRILYFDIETSPMVVYTHYIGSKVSINPCQVKSYKSVICISYAWSDEPMSKVYRMEWDKKTHCDKKMLKSFNQVARSADLLIGHNARNFDVKELRGAMALRGIDEPWCETPCLDTLSDYRRMFRLPSNRLDAIGQQLELGRKNSTNFQLWIDVNNGCKKAMTKMGKYCDQDVKLLRQIHNRLKPYITPTAGEQNLLTRGASLAPSSCKGCDNTNPLYFIKYGAYTYKGQSKQKYMCKMCNKINYPDKEIKN